MKVELRRIELQNYKDLFNETLKKLKNSGREIDVDAIFKLDDDPGSRQWRMIEFRWIWMRNAMTMSQQLQIS